MSSPIAHRDDASLQAWGRGLKTIAPAVQEMIVQQRKAHEADTAVGEALKKIAGQATNGDLPASRRLAAEVQSLSAEYQRLATEREALLKRQESLRSRAEALPGMYRQEHETDEDRLNAPRVSRAAEKRADVSAAEKDA